MPPLVTRGTSLIKGGSDLICIQQFTGSLRLSLEWLTANALEAQRSRTAHGGGKTGSERVDYGGVRNVLAALHGRSVRIALMTAIGVTNREGDYNRQTEPPIRSDAASV